MFDNFLKYVFIPCITSFVIVFVVLSIKSAPNNRYTEMTYDEFLDFAYERNAIDKKHYEEMKKERKDFKKIMSITNY